MSPRRALAPLPTSSLMALLVAAFGAGCPALPQPCDAGSPCPTGLGCVEGVCVAVPVIVAVDGDGTSLPASSTAVPGRRAPHRLRHDLLVRGRHLEGVDDVVLTAVNDNDDDDDDGGIAFSLTVLEADGASMRLALPEALVPGLFTLTLASAAGVAAADVFVLQGEPGPPPAFRTEDADVDDCGTGGQRLFFGVDVDGDGVLDDGEERGSTLACNGAAPPGTGGSVACADGVCRIAESLVVEGSLEVGGGASIGGALGVNGGLDVAGDVVFGGILAVPTVDVDTVIGGSIEADSVVVDGRAVAVRLSAARTVVTATTEAELRARLDEIDGVTIPDGAVYVVELPVVSLPLSASLFIEHADGRRIQIVGRSPTAGTRTLVTCPAAGCIFVGSDGLGLLNDVELAGLDTGVGFQVASGRADIGGNVLVRNFATGILAANGATLVVTGPTQVTACGNAFFAFGSSLLSATGTIALLNRNAGYASQFQATLVASNVTSAQNQRGFFSLNSGSIFATGSTMQGNSFEGLLASEHSYAACIANCTINGNRTLGGADVTAVGSSLVTVNGVIGTTATDNNGRSAVVVQP